jgi:hypothetical protein
MINTASMCDDKENLAMDKKKPQTLEELEVRLLLEKIVKQRKVVTKDESPDWKDVYSLTQKAIQEKFKRNIMLLTFGVILILLFIPVFLPDRIEIVEIIVKILLAVVAGLGLAK